MARFHIAGACALLTGLAVAGSAHAIKPRLPAPAPIDAGVAATPADAGMATLPPATSMDAGVPSASADAGTAAGPRADAGPSADAGPKFVPPPPHASSAVIAAPSSEEVVVGRRFSVFITIDPGRKAILDPSTNFGGAFDVGRRTFKDRKLPSGVTVREYEVEMIAWVVGDLRLPAFTVNYHVNGTAYSAQSKPVPIKVISFIGDAKEQLRDVAPPVTIKRRDWLIVYLIGGLVGTCFIGMIGFFAVRRFRRRKPRPRKVRRGKVPPPVLLRPDQEAFARLEALEQSGALEADDRKHAYIELSEIVRNYMGRRLGFPALDLTTAEIKHRLKLNPETQGLVDEMGVWFEEGDLVRYANYKPSREEAGRAIHQARDFVTKTWAPRPVLRPATAPSPAPTPVAAPTAGAANPAAGYAGAPYAGVAAPAPVTPGPNPVAPPAASVPATQVTTDTIPDQPRDDSEAWGDPPPPVAIAEPVAAPATIAEPVAAPATIAEPVAAPATIAEPAVAPATIAEAAPATIAEPAAEPSPADTLPGTGASANAQTLIEPKGTTDA